MSYTNYVKPKKNKIMIRILEATLIIMHMKSICP
jgi:hypothetical protein